ncbi:cocaine- and amphetamine-regulated transcript protein-like [Hippocampus zosterae]|uniref:cocaine- and amphetamine-regulated transcript protein-like n=1 Tax=Hippocampus zosterae TaxID=109293 RepID=UPI00223CAFF7|nr:cocaine- and amphetamine-regulated transcript protein-like [Hippocampus zosterae]
MLTMSPTRSRPTQSSRRLSCALLCALLLLLQSCPPAQAQFMDTESEEELSPRALRDFYPKGPNLTSEKQLLGALQEVLEKLQTKRLPMWEKKFGQVPTCDIGEQCAVRKGARIGKMCDCPRGAFCNSFLLKCL